MKYCIRLLCIASVSAVFFACAKQTSLSDDNMEQIALDEWVKVHAPNARPLTEGIYYEILQEAGPDAEDIPLGSWVYAEYDIKDTDLNMNYDGSAGNIAYTRSREKAERVGSFTEYTHYIPHFLYYAPTIKESVIIQAQYYALGEMKTGEVWRLYTPSRHVFDSQGFTNRVGYGGQSNISLQKNKPAIIDNFRVLEVVADPSEREIEAVWETAQSWGLQRTDTVRNRANFYIKYLERGGETDTISDGNAVSIYYKAYFLDGKLLDTNIDSVWVNTYGLRRTSSSGTYIDKADSIMLTRKAEANILTSMPAKVFSFILPDLRYKDRIKVVLTSTYAYEQKGRKGYVGSDTDVTYDYNELFYEMGGYSYFGHTYKDESFYNFYNNSSDAFPIPEVKAYTPLIYEIIVRDKVSED